MIFYVGKEVLCRCGDGRLRASSCALGRFIIECRCRCRFVSLVREKVPDAVNLGLALLLCQEAGREDIVFLLVELP